MRAFLKLWTVATLSLLSAAGCKTGSQPSFWPFNKTPAYSNWSKTPPADGAPHSDATLPSQQGAAPAYDPNAGYGQTTPPAGATDPNGYSTIDYGNPPGSAAGGAANQGYAGAGSSQQGPYGAYEQQQTGGAAGGNPYAGAGQSGAQYDRTANARYGTPASGGAGYDTGSRYDTQSGPAGERYAPAANQYSSPGGERYAAPADRYNPATSAAGDSAGASAGAANPADPTWEPGKSDYVPGSTGYPPRSSGVKPYQSPAGQYRSNPNSPSSSWRPGGTKDYQSNNGGASTRAGLTGAAGGDTQNVSYDAPSDADVNASPAGGDSAPLGDRYSQPAATSAGGYGPNGGPVRR